MLILREIVISLFLLLCVGFLMGLYCVCMYLLDEMSAFCVHGANWKFHHMPSFFSRQDIYVEFVMNFHSYCVFHTGLR